MDLAELADTVEKRYRRYLQTTFYFRDAELRSSFQEELASGHLSAGPFLEATPVFTRGQSPQQVFDDVMEEGLDEGFVQALAETTPQLYAHQEGAIRRILDEHNAIVATGTGSGKTEAFLYPVLLELYREHMAGTLGSGVRALVLYPMNALANDQRERLGELCKRFQDLGSSFGFSFGQYIGTTPKHETDRWRNAKDRLNHRLTGEQVLRSEMQAEPPNILLTNYSMLEYLMLRPDDSPLFDQGQAASWKYLILDEAHQYRGTRGMEMAMLLRRLKRRLREGGRDGPFRCIATSATLGKGEEDKPNIAEFATTLFDEPFDSDDVLLGQTKPVPDGSGTAFDTSIYQELNRAYDEDVAGFDELRLDALPEEIAGAVTPAGDLAEDAGRLLELDQRACELRRILTEEGPVKVDELADRLFPGLEADDQRSALGELVGALSKAVDPESQSPLLSSRYHFFLRSLEGAFISLWPEKRVHLDRGSSDEESVTFEVALCRECGQHYLVGAKSFQGRQLGEATRDPSNPGFGASFLRPIEASELHHLDEDESRRQYWLCAQCGIVDNDVPKCGHDQAIPVIKELAPKDEDRADQITRCGYCGYYGGNDPVKEVIHGTDGPHAVISTTLYQSLPAERQKILAFADGRQEAAFFAWYLSNTYRDVLSRNLLLERIRALQAAVPEGLSLGDVARNLREDLRAAGFLSPGATGLTALQEAWTRVYREFLTEQRRISLEGVGLIKWAIAWPDWFTTPQVLLQPPWSLSEGEARDLMFLLLDSMRGDGAVDLKADEGASPSWSDLELQSPQQEIGIGPPKGKKNLKSWDGEGGKRADLLTRILMRKGLDQARARQEAVQTLREVWDHVTESEEQWSAESRLTVSSSKGRRINPNWWRVFSVDESESVYRCSACERVQTVSIEGVCSRYRCQGTLETISPAELSGNHYRVLYQEDLPDRMQVEEHTAQLDSEKAQEFQRRFRDDDIDLLSCSTTFELGVDLGDLDVVFLRNVPPEAFNYAQRVGRSGRRQGHPGCVITYCRRNSHDLYHFAEPRRMLSGSIRPPVLGISNDKIVLRHLVATALSDFFRSHEERFGNVTDFLGDLTAPQACADLRSYLTEHRGRLEATLEDIVPADLWSVLGLDTGGWIDLVAGDESSSSDDSQALEERSSLLDAQTEISSDFANTKELEQRFSQNPEERDYQKADWARKRAETIATENVLQFLSRKAVIPKYGFPVDTVELDTQHTHDKEHQVSLQRDLRIAIAEFAPTSKLVANKKVWTSYAVKKVAEREWTRRRYKRCTRHNVFQQWDLGQPEPASECGDSLTRHEYLIPRYGFVTDGRKPAEPKARASRVFTTRPYFARHLTRSPGQIYLPTSDSPVVDMYKASPGMMVVLCEGRFGRGFYICDTCGAGFRKREQSHRTPYGNRCSGTLGNVSLGHEFTTDVLQLQFRPSVPEHMESIWFAYSLAYALLEGASQVLEVPSTDLNTTVSYSQRQVLVPPIILYDDVPGGGGLVARLEDSSTFKACLEEAKARVTDNCRCGEHTSCYGCLRSYRNQFAHEHLQRGPVRDYLGRLLSQWV